MNQIVFKKSECISSSLIYANTHRAKVKALICVMCSFYYLLGFDELRNDLTFCLKPVIC